MMAGSLFGVPGAVLSLAADWRGRADGGAGDGLLPLGPGGPDAPWLLIVCIGGRACLLEGVHSWREGGGAPREGGEEGGDDHFTVTALVTLKSTWRPLLGEAEVRVLQGSVDAQGHGGDHGGALGHGWSLVSGTHG